MTIAMMTTMTEVMAAAMKIRMMMIIMIIISGCLLHQFRRSDSNCWTWPLGCQSLKD